VLKLRIVSALVLIPLVLGSVYYGGLCFFAVLALALLIAGWEFFDMTRRAGYHPMTPLGLVLIALFLWAAYDPGDWLRPLMALAVVVSMVIGIFRHSTGWLTGWALTLAGALYIGWIGSYAILVRALPSNGLEWTALALLAAWATDIGAFIVGTRFGRHGFFTKISPKKTWEGAIGGWASAVIVTLVLGAFLDVPIIHRILFGFGLSLAATLGDLAESLLKRQTGVKDSGNIVPGHGGLLDRIDSLLFAAVFAYYYLVWILRV
jgi:phosphatidate cytidylyltransferase